MADTSSLPLPITGSRFLVAVSGVPLGAFQSVSGMGFDIAMETVEEGGENYSPHHLPGRMTWQNLVLRAGVVDAGVLMQWALGTSDATPGWSGTPTYSLQVSLLDESRTTTRSWSFLQAVPVSWKGPDLSTAGDEIATETLEVAHHGLDPASV